MSLLEVETKTWTGKFESCSVMDRLNLFSCFRCEECRLKKLDNFHFLCVAEPSRKKYSPMGTMVLFMFSFPLNKGTYHICGMSTLIFKGVILDSHLHIAQYKYI